MLEEERIIIVGLLLTFIGWPLYVFLDTNMIVNFEPIGKLVLYAFIGWFIWKIIKHLVDEKKENNDQSK